MEEARIRESLKKLISAKRTYDYNGSHFSQDKIEIYEEYYNYHYMQENDSTPEPDGFEEWLYYEDPEREEDSRKLTGILETQGINIEMVADLISQQNIGIDNSALDEIYESLIYLNGSFIEGKLYDGLSDLDCELLHINFCDIFNDLANISESFAEESYMLSLKYGESDYREIWYRLSRAEAIDINSLAIAAFGKSFAKLGINVEELPSIALTDDDFVYSYLEHFSEPIENEKIKYYKKCIEFVQEIQRELDKKNKDSRGITPTDVEQATEEVTASNFRSATSAIKAEIKGEQEIATEDKNIED